MLFTFLKYLQPTHYFSLKKLNGISVFPDVKALPEAILKQLESTTVYTSERAKHYDLSWQAVHKGYVGTVRTYTSFEPLSLYDEYCFVRRYFSRFWVFYVLIVRLLSFKNPIREIKVWLDSRRVGRSSFLTKPIVQPQWEDFDSELLKAQPKVSVIIPTLNRYDYLVAVLHDLEQQDYAHFEVIVVDQSEPFKKTFYDNFQLDIQVLYQKEKALWLARNTAIEKAHGRYLLFFDDDSRVATDWILQHLKALDFFKADLSSGVSISQVGAEVPAHYSFFRVSDQLDTGNVLIRREVFEAIGLYDRQFEGQRMGDGEFGLRAFLYGYLNISNPFARRLHLKVRKGGLRELGSWDGFRPKSWLAPRPIPSVLYFYRRYFGDNRAGWALLRTVPLSIMPYRFKSHKVFTIFGILLSVVLLPLVCIQALRSWKLSSQKLGQGPLISPLDHD